MCSLIILTILSAFPIAKNTEYAQGIANPSTTTLSMAVDHTEALVSITPTSANGNFSSSTSEQEARFAVTTNNVTGYNLSIAASDDDGELIGANTNAALSTIGSAVSESTFSSSTSFNNKWGYKPNKYNSSANTNYLPSPTTTASPLDQTNTPNTSANSYSIAIGTRINAATAPDTYENTYILAATANNVPYQINYLDNTGDTITGLPATDNGNNVSAFSFTLSSGEPARQNYVFAGWCHGTVAHVVNGDSTCSGAEYAAGATFNFANPSAVSTNVANLYAMWDAITYDLIVTGDAGLSSMNIRQGSASGTIINGTKSGNTVTFTGLTHGTSYYLYPTLTSSYQFQSWAKTDQVADAVLGSTSTQNTYYTMGSGNGAITLTTSVNKIYIQNLPESECTTTAKTVWDNRDEQPYTIKRLSDGKCWMIDNLNLGADDYSFSGGLSSSNTNITGTVSNADFYQWKNSSTGSATQARFVPVSGTDSSYSNSKYGVLYNYCAASAGTYCASSGSGDAAQDLCPAGWRLPIGGGASDSNNEFKTLYSYYDYTTLRNDAGFSMPGSFTNAGTPSAVDTTNSYYWSSKYYAAAYMYVMRLATTAAYPAQGAQRLTGASVRCVMKPQAKTYIQDLSASECTSTAKTVYDNRDEQPYTVKRLDDGECWMTKNLNLGSAEYPLTVSALDSTNTNTTSSYSSSTFMGWEVDEGTSVGGYQYTTPKFIPLSGTDTNGVDYGTLYNFCAATANSFCYTSSTSTSNMPAEATEDLCPSGWGLPSGGAANTDFYNLYSHYDYSSLTSSSGAGFTLSGLFQNQSNTGKGTTGRYYSKNRSGQQQVKTLNFSNGAFDHNAASYRYAGASVRCIKKGTISDATNMQDVTAGMVANTPDGTTATLRDSRDGNTYTVRKINNSLWMTQNLRFIGDTGSASGTMVMKSATSNVSTDTNLSYTDLTANDYNTARLHNSGNTSNGVWYNYAAASAGTITGSSNNSTEATQDICPKGWRLPSHTENQGVVSAIGTSTSIFNPVTGGYYYSNSIRDSGHARWWSSTASAGTNRYYLRWDGSNLGTFGDGRNRGFYVRCVRPST